MASETAAEDSASTHACAECRIKKVRCIRSSNRAGTDVCDRCFRLGKVCSVPEPKRKVPKGRVRHRLEQLEEHYSEILNLLSTNTHPGPRAATAASQSTPASTISSHAPPEEPVSHIANAQALSHESVRTSMPTSMEGEALLDSYRRMSGAYFPYVLIPQSCTMHSLRMEKPMLSQAILIVAAWQEHARQATLQKEFLEQLGEKLVIQAETSLDLLQALLVYCAWYHFYPAPGARSMYRFVALAMTMALDLGLDRKPSNTTQHDMIMNSTPRSAELRDLSTPKSWSHEATRALVGAYTLSSLCKVLFGIPSPLQYTPYMEQCALALGKDPQFPSDIVLNHQYQAWRVIADIVKTFDNGSTERESEQLDDEKTHQLVKALERQYDAWRTSVPAAAFTNVQIGYNANLVSAYVYEVGLYGTLQGQSPSPIRISLMFSGLASVERYLVDVLALTTAYMTLWTTMDWRLLNYGVMLATRLALTLNATGPTTDSSARLEKLAGWLDELISRTQRIRSLMSGGGQFFAQLSEAWEGVRDWLRRVVREHAVAQPHPPQAQTSSEDASGMGDVNATQSAMAWAPEQDMPWLRFENEDLWAIDTSWLRM